jgi:hypothetical protein
MRLPVPWAEGGANPIVFSADAASAVLVASNGATSAETFVACACAECADRPCVPRPAGGRLFSLEGWLEHLPMTPGATLDGIRIHQEGVDEEPVRQATGARQLRFPSREPGGPRDGNTRSRN